LTVLNDKIYQLTWREGRGLIYDVNKFEAIGSFNYGQSKEGSSTLIMPTSTKQYL